MIIGVMDLFEFLLFFPVFQTQLMQRFYTSLRISTLMRYAILLYCLSLYITKKRKISRITIYVLILQIWTFIVTHINGGHALNWVQALLAIVNIPLLFDIFSDRMDKMLKYLVIYSKIIVYGNALSMLIFRNGLKTLINPPYAPTPMWLIGVSNSFVFWLYPCMVFLIVDYYVNHNKKTLIAIGLAGFMNVLSDSTTGLVGALVLLATLFIPKLKAILTPIRIGIGGVVLFVLIIIIGNSSFLEPIIVGLLGKDMTFSNRLIIWQNAIEAIILNPIMGYGLMGTSAATMILGRLPNGLISGTAMHCHSEYLQIAFKFGLVGVGYFALLIVISLIRCTRRKSDVSLTLGVGLAIVMIMGITEVFAYPLFYMLFVAAFSYDKFDKLTKKDSEEKHE